MYFQFLFANSAHDLFCTKTLVCPFFGQVLFICNTQHQKKHGVESRPVLRKCSVGFDVLYYNLRHWKQEPAVLKRTTVILIHVPEVWHSNTEVFEKIVRMLVTETV